MNNHDCTQIENISKLREAVATLTNAVDNLNSNIIRLDKRCNGTFDAIGKHMNEAPDYRSKIDILMNQVKDIKEEKNNTTKASQWRVGLIVGVIMGLLSIIVNLYLK